MKSIAMIAAVGSLLAALSMPAEALPLVQGDASVQTQDVTEIGWRCGFHRHWNWRLHRCVRNFRY